MNCERREGFVSHYIFENGNPCDPEKLRVRQTEAGKFFKKTVKGFSYHSKELRSLSGAVVTNLSKVESLNGFVLVPPHENFIPCPYQEAFDEIVLKQRQIKKRMAEKEQKQRSKSAPAVESFCRKINSIPFGDNDCEQKETKTRKSACDNKRRVTLKREEECGKIMFAPSHRRSKSKVRETSTSSDDSSSPPACDKNKSKAARKSISQKKSTCESKVAHRHCVSADKYACCDQDSDDDSKAALRNVEEKQSNQSKASRNKTKAVKPAKKGFFATCCSCCVKKPKAVPCSDEKSRSRPLSTCDNAKMTQTTLEDFKRAKRCLRMSIQQEKRRLKMYGRNKKKPIDKFECTREEPKMCIDGVEVEVSQRELAKKEAEYKKARTKYLAKRRKMEQKINKALAREEKLRPKC